MIVLALLSLNSVAQVINFEGVTLGQSMDDTFYNLGYPQKVLYPENKKTLSRDQHGQPIVNLLLFADEDEYAFSHLRVSLEADATRRAEVRANALLNWSLNLLGNTLSSNARNMPSNQTYIIDGKMINCVTMGTITNCN